MEKGLEGNNSNSQIFIIEDLKEDLTLQLSVA